MKKNVKSNYNLKAIVDRANKGCIDDPDEVDEVMNDLLTLPLKRIRDVDADDCIRTLYGPIRESDIIGNIDHTTIDNMSFMDMLVIIDHISKDKWHEFEDHSDAVGFKRCCLKLLIYAMKNYRKYISEVDRFMAVTIGAFHEYVERHRGDPNTRNKNTGPGDLAYYCYRYLDKNIYKDNTIGTLFYTFIGVIEKSWQPWQSLKYYSDKIIYGYKMMEALLIDYIRVANPKEMSFEYVSQKYADKEISYDTENINWDDDLFEDDQPEEKTNNIIRRNYHA